MTRSIELGCLLFALLATTADGQPFPPVVDPSTLVEGEVWVLVGEEIDDSFAGFGDSISTCGDFNGDGFEDLILGGPEVDFGGQETGVAYVVFGGPQLPRVLELSTLDGSNGIRLIGEEEGDLAGFSVSAAGDVDRDGYDDLLVGATAAHDFQGEAYLVYGGPDPPAELALGDLAPADGVSFRSPDSGHLGYVASAGDLNADGFPDILLGAPELPPSSAGAAYVVYGGPALPAVIDVTSIDPAEGSSLFGYEEFGGIGGSLSTPGDFDGDGFDDVVLGSQFGNRDLFTSTGASYVVFGGLGLAGEIDLEDLDGGNGFKVNGIFSSSNFGKSVSMGDLNGDGLADLIAGAPRTITVAPGDAFVVFGAPGPFLAELDAADLDGINGFEIPGSTKTRRWGSRSPRSEISMGIASRTS